MRLLVLLIGLATLNIFLGFIYQWFIVTNLGQGRQTDALYAAMVIPQLILTVFSGSLLNVLIPFLSTKQEGKFCKDAWSFFQITTLIFIIIGFLLFLTAKFWVPVTVPGFDANSKSSTISIIYVKLLGMVFTSMNLVLLAVNHARQRFIMVGSMFYLKLGLWY